MDCYICGNQYDFEKPAGDHKHVRCVNCGEYKIAGTAVAVAKTRTIDVEAIQALIQIRRDEGIEIPVVLEAEMKYKLN